MKNKNLVAIFLPLLIIGCGDERREASILTEQYTVTDIRCPRMEGARIAHVAERGRKETFCWREGTPDDILLLDDAGKVARVLNRNQLHSSARKNQ